MDNAEMTMQNAERNPFFAAICNICTATEDPRTAIMDFTVEEINLIAVYKEGTAAATLSRIAARIHDMDTDMYDIAVSASMKLAALSEREYTAIPFSPADDTDGE